MTKKKHRKASRSPGSSRSPENRERKSKKKKSKSRKENRSKSCSSRSKSRSPHKTEKAKVPAAAEASVTKVNETITTTVASALPVPIEIVTEEVKSVPESKQKKIQIGSFKDKNKLNVQSVLMNLSKESELKRLKSSEQNETETGLEQDASIALALETSKSNEDTEKKSEERESKKEKPETEAYEKSPKSKSSSKSSKKEKEAPKEKKSKNHRASESRERPNARRDSEKRHHSKTKSREKSVVQVSSEIKAEAAATSANTEVKFANESSTTKRKHRDSTVTNDDHSSSKYHRSSSKEHSYISLSHRRSHTETTAANKFDDYRTSSSSSSIHRYSRGSKYTGFRQSNRYYQQYNPSYHPHSTTTDHNSYEYSVNTAMDHVEIDSDDDLEDVIPVSEASSKDENKKISPKIIDMIDADWSILGNKYFKTETPASEQLASVLSTVGVLDEYLDEETLIKLKEFMATKNIINTNECKLLSLIKQELNNGVIYNNSFKNSGITMRNDIKRRKGLYFHQHQQQHITSGETAKAANETDYDNSIHQNYSFYQETLELLKEKEDEKMKSN